MDARVLYHKIMAYEDGMILRDVLRNKFHLVAHDLARAKYHTKNGITVNGEVSLVNRVLREGDEVRVRLLYEEPEKVVPVEGPLEILYEDEDLICLNKPAGVVVHPSHGHFADTLANALAYYWKEKGEPHEIRPVGRLDKDTSGVITFAKSRTAAAILAGQTGAVPRSEEAGVPGGMPEVEVPGNASRAESFRTPESARDAAEPGKTGTMEEHTAYGKSSCALSKVYLALAAGTFIKTEGTIEAPISREYEDRIRRVVRADGAYAVTRYKVLQQYDGYALLEVVIGTGRTHQIRVHMAHIGHPLLGDPIYGNPVCGDPVRGNPVYGDPACGNPVFEEMTCGKMVFDEPVCRDPVYGDVLYAEMLYGAVFPEDLSDDSLFCRKESRARKSIRFPRRAALHAWKARFAQPFTGELLEVTAPLPEDMALCLT